jgi:hypothetical protein
MKLDSSQTEPLEIVLEQDGLITDTCLKKGEEVLIYLPINNHSNATIFTQKKVTVWYDSGFDTYSQFTGELVFLESGETKVIEIKVVPASRSTVNRIGLIPIKSTKFEHPGIKMKLLLKYSIKSCGKD